VRQSGGCTEKLFIDVAGFTVHAPGWRSGYRASLEIEKSKAARLKFGGIAGGRKLAGVRVPSPAPNFCKNF
jgi:hypothetical protein